MRIFVIGGAGFIGSHIVDACIEKGHQVFVIDNLSTGSKENLNPKAKFYQIDIFKQKPKLEQIFFKIKPDIVNLHAAQKSVSNSVINPINDAETNILGALNVFQVCVKNKIKKIIFASSGGAIYGDNNNLPTSETQELYPESPYGVAKLAVEKYLNFYWLEYKIPYAILRYANVYGPRQDPKGEAGVVAIFSNSLLKNQPCVIYGDGTQTRDYVFVKDIAQANLLALKNKKNFCINIGTKKETSVNKLFNIIKKETKSQIIASYAKARPGEQKRSVLNNRQAKKILGWEPKTQLEKGIKETINWYQNN